MGPRPSKGRRLPSTLRFSPDTIPPVSSHSLGSHREGRSHTTEQMRLLCLLMPIWELAAAQTCTTDSCLRALQDFEPTGRNGTADCLSALQTTSTPEAGTVFHTLRVTSTSTTTRNTTLTSAPSTSPEPRIGSPHAAGEPWRRWLAEREAFTQLAGGSPSSAPLAYPSDAPTYASECGSPSSYVSACSCLGVTPAVVTARVPLTTSSIFVTAFITSTSVRTRYANSTTWRNATSSVISLNSTAVSESTPPRPTSPFTDPRVIVDGRHPSRTGSVGSNNSATSAPAGIETPKSAGVAEGAPLASATSLVSLNSTLSTSLTESSASPRIYINTTLSSADGVSTRASPKPTGWSAFPNITAASSAPFANTTSHPLANSTAGRFQNSTMTATATSTNTTSAPFLNTTTSRFRNVNTTTARFWNTTAPAMNATTARFWNTTAGPRFRNTSTPTATPSSTATVDRTCGETAAAFGLAASQPSGFIDGWRLRQSGSSVVLVAGPSRASLFSVGASGRLCAVGREGPLGNAVVAVVEARRGRAGDASPLWFVDGALVANLTGLGYAELRCADPSGGALACAARESMRTWMGCGLQVTISSGGEAEYEGIECKGVELLVSGGNGTRGGGGGNDTSVRGPALLPTASLNAGDSSLRGSVALTSPNFAGVRRRQQGWGFLLGPLLGFESKDGDL
ncbi:hypothetical protein RB595_001893 [Gaeumannomyces hyphopodioides]